MQEAERRLLQQLEGIIGGLLPEILLKQPLSQWEQDEQLHLLAAARKYATAVLRHFYRSARHLSLLAGLLASLPSGKGQFRAPCQIYVPMQDIASALMCSNFNLELPPGCHLFLGTPQYRSRQPVLKAWL